MEVKKKGEIAVKVDMAMKFSNNCNGFLKNIHSMNIDIAYIDEGGATGIKFFGVPDKGEPEELSNEHYSCFVSLKSSGDLLPKEEAVKKWEEANQIIKLLRR